MSVARLLFSSLPSLPAKLFYDVYREPPTYLALLYLLLDSICSFAEVLLWSKSGWGPLQLVLVLLLLLVPLLPLFL